MLAKPSKIADGRRVTKTLNTIDEMDGETASAKRRQGICQAAGELATPSRLTQPRKQPDVEADLVTSRGRQHSHDRIGKAVRVPPGSSKIVAW